MVFLLPQRGWVAVSLGYGGVGFHASLARGGVGSRLGLIRGEFGLRRSSDHLVLAGCGAGGVQLVY